MNSERALSDVNSTSQVDGVPLLDLTRFENDENEQFEAAFKRVLESGRYIMGPEVDAFEASCATYCGTKHALGVSSGSDALLLALMGLDLGPGDEVICPTFTFFATAGAIWRTGARPVFVDLDPVTFNCDPDEIAAKIGPATKAIIPVHLFGQCANMAPILEAARAKGIAVIEDAAQAIGSEIDGKRAGSFGTCGCFSFFPSKNLGAFGDAGLVTTNDSEYFEKLKILRVHGGNPKYYHRLVGGNFRIDALQAALLNIKLPLLDRATERRQANAELYTSLLKESGVAETSDGTSSESPLGLPKTVQSRHIYNQYSLRVRGGRRDALREHLTERGVGTEIYYPVPLHLQDCFVELRHSEGDFPHSEAAAGEILAVPIFPELRPEEIRYVVEQIVSFFKR